MTVKTVEFTCMPAGSQADFYKLKVDHGDLIPELEDMETSFFSQVYPLQISMVFFGFLFLEVKTKVF